MGTDHGLEFPVSEVLQTQVDAQLHILAGPGVPDQHEILDHPTAIVFQYALAAWLTGQPLVIRQLDTFLAVFVNIGEADNVSSYFARRIVTTILLP